MIKIIAVGKIKKDYLKEGIEYYLKQIKNKVLIIEIDDGKNEQYMDHEGTKILEKINSNDYVITLEIEGEELSSEGLAEKINDLQANSREIVFIIGGSYGLSTDVKKRSNFHLSFSKMTFPHQLMRLVLVEQIYRAFTIINNHPYHK